MTRRDAGPRTDRPARVVVADDDVDARFVLVQWLRATGSYEVVEEVEDGAAAVAAARRTRPDLVLLDLAMPHMDGLEAASRIRALLPDVGVVVQSGFSATRMAQKAIDAGADVYIQKSSGPGDLLDALDTLWQPVRRSAPVAASLRALGPATPREQVLLDALECGVVFTDQHGFVVTANFPGTLMMGVSTSEVHGWDLSRQLRSARPLGGAAAAAGRRDPLSEVLASGRPQAATAVVVQRPDRTEAVISIAARAMFEDAGGKPSGAVVSLHDITEEHESRRLARDAPQAAEVPTAGTAELLEAALVSSPVGTALFDRSGRLVLANPVADELLGSAALLGQGAAARSVRRTDTMAPVAFADLPIREACQGEPFDDLSLIVVTADGPDEETYLKVSGRPVHGPDGHPVGAVVTVLDDTAAVRAQQSLASIHEELQRSNADLESFAYVVSHDLQQPLQTVDGFAQMLREGGLDADQERLCVDRIVSGCEHMRTLIDDLLGYSQVTTTARPLEPVALSDVVDDAVARCHHQVVGSGARIDVGTLPTVLGDRSQLTRLVQNLLGNALTYVAPGTSPAIDITCAPRHQQWLVVIADHGIGIRAEDRVKAFSVFQRLHADESYPGTGIGLAVCAKIVDRHGGRIWIEDNDHGQGVRMCFTLPAVTPAADSSG